VKVIDSSKVGLITTVSAFSSQVLNCLSFTLVTFLHPTSEAVMALSFICSGKFATD
jgi:hypothetical protein